MLSRICARLPERVVVPLGLLVLVVCGRPAGAQDFSRTAPLVAAKLTAAQKKSVAVADFTDLQMNVTELGRYLAEAFQEALVNEAKTFRVIDRTHLKAIIQEAKLSSTGIIDPSTARQLGRIAGVEALVTGSITQFGDSVRLSVKVLDASSADVLSMNSIDVPKTNAIALLIGQSITAAPSVTSRNNATSGGGVTAVPAARQPQSSHGMLFELNRCLRSATSVTCEISVVSPGADSGVMILTSSRAFDVNGNEHQVRSVELAKRKVTTSWLREGPQTKLIQDIPARAVLMLDEIPRDSESLPLLEIQCITGNSIGGTSGGIQEFVVSFRNVHLDR